MKIFSHNLLLLFIVLLIGGTFYLSLIGLETSKFNNIIAHEIKKKDPLLVVKLKKIQIKFDIKEFQIYLSTHNPSVNYQNINIPIKEINIYSKIIPLIKSKIEINQINFLIENFDINKIQTAASRIKPSNLKTYLLNNLKKGDVTNFFGHIGFDNNYKITDYKFNGNVEKVDLQFRDTHIIEDLKLNFVADKNLVLLNSISANYKNLKISNGSIEVENKEEIFIKGKLDSELAFNEKDIFNFTKDSFFEENKLNGKGNLVHDFNFNLDSSYKLTAYNYAISGNIEDSQINLKKNLKSQFLEKSIKNILFSNTKIEAKINNQNKNTLYLEGLYSTKDNNFKKFKIDGVLNKNAQKYNVDLDLQESILIKFLNFKSNKKINANIKSEFRIDDKNINFKSIIFNDTNNLITINGLLLNSKYEIKNLSNMTLVTYKDKKENNNFKINIKDKIIIGGKQFDSTNLLKLLNSKSDKNILKNFTKEIEINLQNIITKSNISINNFRLIGNIEKGKFSKISAKSEFSEEKFLDISLKKDSSNRKILEIYSDIPKALLTDYKFFEGIKEGKLFYNSVIDGDISVSKLTIENFKLIKAPAFATLLTLADLGGVADILKGEGISFDILEISLKENKDITTIEEILALGSSISVIMKGYTEKKTGLVSLNGTLVPAKTLNSLVSKIPIVGNILVGEKVGEGVFGFSFKIKGLPGSVKTTVNPVKTLTPRFITRALDKMRKN